MVHPAPDPELALSYLEGSRDTEPLFAEARRLRDEGKGKTVTYSRKVFIPLTTLCRDKCTYCTFVKPPGAGGMYLTPDEVLAISRAGESYGCTEALFTLGDRPEDRWATARDFLDSHGYESTMDYVVAMSELVFAETKLFPHANPGIMSRTDLERLRATNISAGLMLENISDRLLEPGMPHYQCPDKIPALRMSTIRAAAEARVPFTTGVLIGIGENEVEIIDSLAALAQEQATTGGIQEIIVQNFRAKADTRMRFSEEPAPDFFATVVALARWFFGPQMNVQVPPNLTERYEGLLDAGVNDWGGVSPVTIDWVNPEQPWPHLDELRTRTQEAGFELVPRLPTYPEFLTESWLADGVAAKASEVVDERGYVAAIEVAA